MAIIFGQSNLGQAAELSHAHANNSDTLRRRFRRSLTAAISSFLIARQALMKTVSCSNPPFQCDRPFGLQKNFASDRSQKLDGPETGSVLVVMRTRRH
jgi:hypothetical protein